MKFGYFDDANREYVITNPQTPWPWINYLGSEDFFTLVSNTAGGYSFFKDAKFRRITRYRYNGVPMDAGGMYFYVKDGETVVEDAKGYYDTSSAMYKVFIIKRKLMLWRYGLRVKEVRRENR